MALPMALAAIILFAAGASAHGLGYTLLDAGGVGFEARFSSGEPVAYAAVLVHAPDEDGPEFMNGRTDRLGRFAFVPDGPGEWRVAVDAGLGHRLDFTLAVDEGRAVAAGPAAQSTPLWLKAMLGLSLLANAWSLAERWRTRRRRASTATSAEA